MKPRIVAASCALPGGRTLELLSHDGRPLLHIHGEQVVGGLTAGGEDELARLACAPLRAARQPRLLLIGLGLGRILRGVLAALPQRRLQVTVAEPLAELVGWHRAGLAGLDPQPLADPRVAWRPVPAGEALRGLDSPPHAILLHLDGGAVLAGGAAAVPTEDRGWLAAARDVLRPGGLLVVGAARAQRGLGRLLREAGFDVAETNVHGSAVARRPRPQPLWLARKPERPD